jgi:hypothetical protein
MIAHILTGQSLTVLLDGRTIAIPRSHVNFDGILEATLNDETDELRTLIDVKATIPRWANGVIEVVDRELFYKGNRLNSNLTNKIVDFIRDGDPRLAIPLCNFLDKVQQNPSFRAVSGLYDWVSASNMPIHEDGDILAWKCVDNDYFDYYSHTLDHTPGNTIWLPRNQCDEDPDQTCSSGIHFCSYDYLPNYLNKSDVRVVLVKINPADVVAIPKEYGTAKGRCCEMTVVQEVPKDQLEGVFPTRTVWFETPTGSKFKVGQQWKDSDGDVHTIIEVNEEDEVIRTTYNEGEFHFAPDGEILYSSLALVELVEEAPEPAPTFEIGQRWLCRDGVVRKIVGSASHSPGTIFQLDDGSWDWVENGGTFRGTWAELDSDQDLITLVDDVA